MFCPSDFRIVLCSPEGEANVGATARSMACFGLTDLVLVTPHHLPDEQAHNWSCHGSTILEHARIVSSLDEALSEVNLAVGFTRRTGRKRHKVSTVADLSQELQQHPNPGRVALLFGTEMSGLSTEELDACHRLAIIPSLGSLNLGHAVSIALYELFGRSLQPELKPQVKPLKAQLLAAPEKLAPPQLTKCMLSAIADHLRTMGYPFHKASLSEEMKKLANIVDRARLETWETNFLGGLFKHLRLRFEELSQQQAAPPHHNIGEE